MTPMAERAEHWIKKAHPKRKTVRILHGRASKMMKQHVEDESVHLVWTDPPFNTGDRQKVVSTGKFYDDKHDDYERMLRSTFRQCHRVLHRRGVCCVCLDYREVHEAKALLDEVFGREMYRGEVIWHFELGNISKSWWTNKHNTILTYAKSDQAVFHFDRVPTTLRKSPKGTYTAPKKVTSVWNFTMSNSDAQRVGYPNQKPLEIIEPFVLVHTEEGDTVLDPFAGSGSTGEAALKNNRNAVLIDRNEEAILVARKRLDLGAQDIGERQ